MNPMTRPESILEDAYVLLEEAERLDRGARAPAGMQTARSALLRQKALRMICELCPESRVEARMRDESGRVIGCRGFSR